MNATDFIISNLMKISDEIAGVNLKYAYDEITAFHIIEVSPEDIRRGNDSYMKMECDLWENFQNQYPNEDILICEVDCTNNMQNLLYENQSTAYLTDEQVPFSFELDSEGQYDYVDIYPLAA